MKKENIVYLCKEIDDLEKSNFYCTIIASLLLIIPILGWIISIILFFTIQSRKLSINSKSRLISVYNTQYIVESVTNVE